MSNSQTDELAFLVDNVDGTVVGNGRRGRGGERSQRLLVVERSRERQRDLREKRLSLGHAGRLCLGKLPLGDVARDLGCTDDLAVGIEYR